jgi:hypothetical protein
MERTFFKLDPICRTKPCDTQPHLGNKEESLNKERGISKRGFRRTERDGSGGRIRVEQQNASGLHTDCPFVFDLR